MFHGATVLAAVCAAAFALTLQAPPILVSAAISLTDALTEIAGLYEKAGRGEVRFNFAGSNVLSRQIVNGAPADLFISADVAQMDLARAAGAVDAPRPLLRNRLAVVTPPGRAGTVRTIDAVTGLRRIAIGDPTAVPAGVYARQFLVALGMWDAVQPRLVPLANVRAALAAAASGGVDAAIVYESDAAASTRVDLAFVIDDPRAPAILYPAAIVSRSRSKAAAADFLAFLHTPEASAVFRRFRFTVAETGGARQP